MTEPKWLLREAVLAVHRSLVATHGGDPGLRDAGLLDSALMRARDRWGYGKDASLSALAAAYAYGLARNHPFVDGNKRIAFIAMTMFLRINGRRLEAERMDALRTFLGLAAGEVKERDLAGWIERNSVPLDQT